MGKVLDGTFNVMNGALKIVKSGRITQEILDHIKELSKKAQSGEINPNDALDQVSTLLPPELAATVKQLGTDNPIAKILMIIAILTMLLTAGEKASNIYRSFGPSNPTPPIIINNDITINNNGASRDKSNQPVAGAIKREQARRLRQMESQKQKRRERGDDETGPKDI